MCNLPNSKSFALKTDSSNRQVGASIQGVFDHYALVRRLIEAGAVKFDQHDLVRYSNGEVICPRPGEEWMSEHSGYDW